MTTETIAPHSLTAYNYAEASENKIHSDEVAGEYGFRGGLVPGVALYAYLTVPIVKTLGEDWLRSGRMSAKFIRPVYDDERVTVSAQPLDDPYPSYQSTLVNSQDELCSVANAWVPADPPGVDISRFPYRPMPEEQREASIEDLPEGTELGSLQIEFHGENTQGEFANFLEEMREELPIYRGKDARLHPAYWVAKANRLLKENVNLGPWIHSASDVQHHALAEPGESIFLNGHVQHAYRKRGHEIVVLELVARGANERVLVHMTHTAIVKLAKAGDASIG